MEASNLKVGIISCSGEEIAGGTISRLATRRVLELLRPENTVTICLPLFLAGNEAERKFAQEHPTITIDGCDKMCAKKCTEKYSGETSASLVVPDILQKDCSEYSISTKSLTEMDREAVWMVAEKLARTVDGILEENQSCCETASGEQSGGCGCSRPVPAMHIEVEGETVPVPGLALIFDHLAQSGLPADESAADKLLETVSVYHQIEPEKEKSYKTALTSAYISFRRKA
jgi:uncharacterized metal-binding protein